MSKSKEGMVEALKSNAVRARSDASRSTVADTAKPRGEAKGPTSGASRTPPPNARVIKNSYKTGTVSRRAVRAAIKRLRAEA